jgi:hypothetical protein
MAVEVVAGEPPSLLEKAAVLALPVLSGALARLCIPDLWTHPSWHSRDQRRTENATD